jgi:hypothetical protein
MKTLNFISSSEFDAAIQEKLPTKATTKAAETAPYFIDAARKQLAEMKIPAEGSLVKKVEDKTVWLIGNGTRHGFINGSIFSSLGFSFARVLEVLVNELVALPEGPLINNADAAHGPLGFRPRRDGRGSLDHLNMDRRPLVL